MGANVYYIGKKYEDAFKSICALVKENCVPGEIVTSANGREIVTPAYRFVYDDAALGFDGRGGELVCASSRSKQGQRHRRMAQPGRKRRGKLSLALFSG